MKNLKFFFELVTSLVDNVGLLVVLLFVDLVLFIFRNIIIKPYVSGNVYNYYMIGSYGIIVFCIVVIFLWVLLNFFLCSEFRIKRIIRLLSDADKKALLYLYKNETVNVSILEHKYQRLAYYGLVIRPAIFTPNEVCFTLQPYIRRYIDKHPGCLD